MKSPVSISKLPGIILLPVIIFLSLSYQASAQLSGSYDIDPDGPGPYYSLTDAVNALTTNGVSANVTFNIAPGIYDEQIVIPAISGAGVSARIFFESSTRDATDVIITFSGYTSDANNYIIKLDGCSYITFQDLTFDATSGNPDYGIVFHLLNGAERNQIWDNIIYGKTTGSSGKTNLIHAFETTGRGNSIKDNVLTNGEYGVYATGISAGFLCLDFGVYNNNFMNQKSGSIFLKYHQNPLVRNNTITNTDFSGTTAIFLETVMYSMDLTKNIINITDPDAGIHLTDCEGQITGSLMIANNSIAIRNVSNYENTGLRIDSCTYLDIYHNSVHISGGQKDNSRCLYNSTGSANLDIRNNIFSNFTGGYAYSINNGAAVTQSDYNNYYTTGNYLAAWDGSSLTDLGELINANGYDNNSLSVHPVFTSDSDLHTNTFRLESMGTDLTSDVPDDIDGESRSGTPDIGADEFSGTGSALSGTVTIGPGQTYTTISDAVDTLNKYGINSGVTFSILPSGSPYNEQFEILPVTGSGVSDQVVFESSTGNAADVEITFKATAEKPYTVQLQRTGFVNFSDVTISATDSTFSTAVSMGGYCSNISINNCMINSIGITENTGAVYSKNNLLEHIDISGNILDDGYNGVFLDCNNTGQSNNLTIAGNLVQHHYAYGIFLADNDVPSVTGNTIISDSTAYYYYGIKLQNCTNDFLISKNKITVYCKWGGIMVSNSDGNNVDRALISNNMIDLYREGGIHGDQMIGINTNNSDYVNVYFNTVRIDRSNTNPNTSPYYNYGGSYIFVLNNIFCNYGAGRAYYNRTPSAIYSSNYNCLYTGGEYIACWSFDNITTFDEFLTISSADTNSISINPALLAEDDLHANSWFLDNKGIKITGMNDDFDGDIRADPPDIGADEYTSTIYPLDNGTYTIGGTSPDYATIKEAMKDLQYKGVLAPTTFKIRPGEYNEFIGDIHKIPGANATNPVTLMSETGSREDVTIRYNTTLQEHNIFAFIRMEYFTLRDVTILSTGITYGRPVNISGRANDLKLMNNHFSSVNSDSRCVSIYCFTDSLLIFDNLITDGRYGIYHIGDRYEHSTNTRIVNNLIEGPSREGIFLRDQDSPEIIGNRIINQTSDSFDGMVLEGNSDMVVTGNTVYCKFSGLGIYIEACESIIPFAGIISNNMIHLGGYSEAIGIYVYESSRIFLYHNSVNISSNDEDNGIGFYIRDENFEIEMVNNIMANTGDGYALTVDEPASVARSDFNNIFAAGTGRYATWGSEVADLAELQTASNMDTNSLSLDPLFYSETDLRSKQPGLIEKATPLGEVPYDIDSILRDPLHPDIGAAEIVCLLSLTFNDISDVSCSSQNDGSIDLTVTGNAPPYSFDWSNGDTTEDVSGLSPGQHIVVVTDTNMCTASDSAIITEPPVLLANITDSINVSSPGGNDGQAKVAAIGGTPPYSFLWDDESNTADSMVTGLFANKYYHVSVTDFNGCFALDSVILSEPGVLRVKIVDSTLITCNEGADGSATATVSGGDPPYTLQWNDDDSTKTNQATGLSSGRWYRVVVSDSKGQNSRDSIMLPNPESFTINKDYSGKICPGESNGFIDIDVSGGTPPYTLLWNTGDTTSTLENLYIGEYVINITDANGCTTNDTIRIDTFTTYHGEEICMVTVSNSNRLLIVWEKTENKRIAYYNLYRRSLTGGFDKIGTQPYESLSIFQDEASVPDEMSYEYTISSVDSCGNESDLSPLHKSIHLNASRGDKVMNLVWNEYEGYEYFNYQIYRGSSYLDLHKYRLVPYTNLTYTDTDPPPGVLYYRIGATKLEPCYPRGSAKKGLNDEYELAMSNIDDNGLIAIKDQSINQAIIYPNPVNNTATIYFDNPEEKSYKLYVFDLSGKVCRLIDDVSTSKYTLDRGNLNAGIYFLELRGEKTFRSKIVFE